MPETPTSLMLNCAATGGARPARRKVSPQNGLTSAKARQRFLGLPLEFRFRQAFDAAAKRLDCGAPACSGRVARADLPLERREKTPRHADVVLLAQDRLQILEGADESMESLARGFGRDQGPEELRAIPQILGANSDVMPLLLICLPNLVAAVLELVVALASFRATRDAIFSCRTPSRAGSTSQSPASIQPTRRENNFAVCGAASAAISSS